MCFDEGTLQAYLDGETTNEERQQIESHLTGCSHCRNTLANLEDNDNFVSLHLATYKKQIERLESAPGYESGNWQHSENSLRSGKGEKYSSRVSDKDKKGVFALLGRYRKIATGVAAAAVLGILFSFAPVRSVAANFLTLFRVQKVETTTISMEELNQIQQAFYSKSSDLNINNFGRVENRRTGELMQVRLEEAEDALGFKPKMPDYLPEGLKVRRDMSLEPANRIEFTLNVKNVNAVVKHLGGTHLLPENLDGKAFTISFNQALQASAHSEQSSGEQKNSKQIGFLQTKSPDVKVPENVDVDEVRKAILDLPVIPDDVKNKLAALKNWQDTLYVPQPENGTTETVKINSSDGVIIKQKWADSSRNTLIWQESGMFYILEGYNLDDSELVRVAESLK